MKAFDGLNCTYLNIYIYVSVIVLQLRIARNMIRQEEKNTKEVAPCLLSVAAYKRALMHLKRAACIQRAASASPVTKSPSHQREDGRCKRAPFMHIYLRVSTIGKRAAHERNPSRCALHMAAHPTGAVIVSGLVDGAQRRFNGNSMEMQRRRDARTATPLRIRTSTKEAFVIVERARDFNC